MRYMRQITVKSLRQYLVWITTQPCFEAGQEGPYDKPTHLYYRNGQDKMRLPLTSEGRKWNRYITVNDRPYDTRMYKPTRRGLEFLGITKRQWEKGEVS